MALGCPVVATDQASVPEICGDAVLFASPNDREAWLKQILRLRRSEALRAELISRGRSRAKAFTWRKSAEQYLELMARADGITLSSGRDPTLSAAHHAQA
jgi:glycosyltransferase involved in cell wall biosynthesis